MKNEIISIDFDGTIVDFAYPNVGKPKPNVVAVIQRLRSEGHKILIFTCRTSKKDIDAAKDMLDTYCIPYDGINENVPNAIFPAYPKIHAHLYIDDRQLGGIPEDWEDIYKIIKAHEQVTEVT